MLLEIIAALLAGILWCAIDARLEQRLNSRRLIRILRNQERQSAHGKPVGNREQTVVEA